jgi:uncharacterized protein YlxW (UPF0749 family)
VDEYCEFEWKMSCVSNQVCLSFLLAEMAVRFWPKTKQRQPHCLDRQHSSANNLIYFLYYTLQHTHTDTIMSAAEEVAATEKKPAEAEEVEEVEEEDEEEDLEKLQAEIARMEDEAAKITKETEELENKKNSKLSAGNGDAAAKATGAGGDGPSRDGCVRVCKHNWVVMVVLGLSFLL